MRKYPLLVLLSLCLLCYQTQAQQAPQTQQVQQIQVTNANSPFLGKTVKGYSTTVAVDYKTVEKAWTRKIREFGKPESLADKGLVLKSVTVTSISNSLITLFSRIEKTANGAMLFAGALDEASSAVENHGFQQWLYDFALGQYREDMSRQIQEADKSVESAVKLLENLNSKAERLERDKEKNAREKLRLQQQMQENLDNRLRITMDSTKTVKDRATTMEEITRLRQIVEDKKAKLAEIK